MVIIGVVLERTRPIRPTMRPLADGSPLCLVHPSICWLVDWLVGNAFVKNIDICDQIVIVIMQ